MPPIERRHSKRRCSRSASRLLVVLCLLSPLSPLVAPRWRSPRRPRLPLGDPRRPAVAALRRSATRSIRPRRSGSKPFTPLVIGETAMGNFESHRDGVLGHSCASSPPRVLLWLGGRSSARRDGARRLPDARPAAAIAAAFGIAIVSPTAQASDTIAGLLQARIDAAPRGSTVSLAAGILCRAGRHSRSADGHRRAGRGDRRRRRSAASSRSAATASCFADSRCATADAR